MTETIQKADLKILHDFEDRIASIEQRLDSGLDQIVEQAAPIGMNYSKRLDALEDYICERLDELDKVVSQGKVKGPELLWRSMKPAEKYPLSRCCWTRAVQGKRWQIILK